MITQELIRRIQIQARDLTGTQTSKYMRLSREHGLALETIKRICNGRYKPAKEAK